MAKKRLKKKRWKAQGGTLRCILCGKLLWQYRGDYVVGRSGVVCHTCLRTGCIMTRTVQEQPPQIAPAVQPVSPQGIVERLDRIIAGQEEAKRAVSLAVWKQTLRANGEDPVPSSHLLLDCPTGCGKTFLATQSARFADLPVCVFDTTTLSEAGYRGRDAVDVLKDYKAAAEGHPKEGWGVVILDEVDKLAARGGSERQAYMRGTQHTLLKLLEGTVYEDVDSARLLFILCGVFHGIEEEWPDQIRPIGFQRKQETISTAAGPDRFVAFGMERELMGRVPGLAAIRALEEEDLLHILLEKEGSAFHVYRDFFRGRGVTLDLPERSARELARRALARGTGARALKAELDRVMEPLMLRLAAEELEGKVSIDVDGLLDL